MPAFPVVLHCLFAWKLALESFKALEKYHFGAGGGGVLLATIFINKSQLKWITEMDLK